MPTIKNARFQQRRNTSEYWRVNPQFVPLAGEIVVYTDYQILNGKFIPGVKIGDGQTSIVDLPFISNGEGGGGAETLNALNEHIADDVRHVSVAERILWNNKLNYRMDGETLVFTTD